MNPRTGRRLGAQLGRLATSAGRRRARQKCADVGAQWLWWLPGVDRGRIGLGPGPWTWIREARHSKLDRPMSITLLEYPRPRLIFGRLMAAWINDNSEHFKARVNRGVTAADVVWVYSQDPLSQRSSEALRHALARARADAVVVNPLDRYNAYHEAECFPTLEAAGVSVPRSDGRLAEGESAIYKRAGEQASVKTREPYTGPKPGYRAFEFVDGWKDDGFHRYRAFYLFGAVRPSKLQVSRDWNVCLSTSHRIEYSFVATSAKEQQIRAIAEVLGLDYFAVDYVRRGGHGRAVFLDINIYPTVRSVLETRPLAPAYGEVHTFDTRCRLGVAEPTGIPTPQLFDAALLEHVHRNGSTDGNGVARRPPLST